MDTWVSPHTSCGIQIGQLLGKPLEREYRLFDLLKRPETDYASLMQIPGLDGGITDKTVAQQVQIQAKYAGYILRQQAEIGRQQRHEETSLPLHLDYSRVQGLSSEVRQKLTEVRPQTIGQASRIPGVTPAAISLLLVYLKKVQSNEAR
jgi:tRNA uridine 5-carboxymethylaminomethyl modification enzyme